MGAGLRAAAAAVSAQGSACRLWGSPARLWLRPDPGLSLSGAEKLPRRKLPPNLPSGRGGRAGRIVIKGNPVSWLKGLWAGQSASGSASSGAVLCSIGSPLLSTFLLEHAGGRVSVLWFGLRALPPRCRCPCCRDVCPALLPSRTGPPPGSPPTASALPRTGPGFQPSPHRSAAAALPCTVGTQGSPGILALSPLPCPR